MQPSLSQIRSFPAIIPVPPATLEWAGGESEAGIAGEARCTAWETASVLCDIHDMHDIYVVVQSDGKM